MACLVRIGNGTVCLNLSNLGEFSPSISFDVVVRVWRNA